MMDLDDEERAHFDANVAWLASADPDDWHRAALDFNWSEPLYLLDWIVRQDRCDAATALTIFWAGQPTCWLAEEGSGEEEPGGYSYLNRKICEYVADRVGRGGYSRSEIAFAPEVLTRADFVELGTEAERLERPNIRPHPDLIRDRPGRPVELDADFYARYPAAFHRSYFDEQLSDALEEGKLFTPETQATWDRVQQVTEQVRLSLPEHLQGSPPEAAVADQSAASPPSESAAARRVRALRNSLDVTEQEGDAAGGVLGWFRHRFRR